MAWTERTVMDDRLCFAAAHLRGEAPMGALCARFGISRKTGYKWLSRYEAEGAAGLEDRSRARHAQSLAIEAATAGTIITLRGRHPTWGPRKLLARLGMDHPDLSRPAASTVGDLLRREGMSKPRRRREREPRPPRPEVQPSAPNQVWSADFKGWFRTGDKVRCEPFTVSDVCSRYLFACRAVPRITAEEVRPRCSTGGERQTSLGQHHDGARKTWVVRPPSH